MNLGKINIQSIDISGFTSVLKQFEAMPSSLYSVGNIPENKLPSVAIIGSRKPTDYGKEVTYRLAYDLAKYGIVVVSGLAYGIDKVAHQACLDAGGTTIAVMANGLHRVYPAAHEQLARQIVKQGGALISEQAPGSDARPYQFLARNRIVSGLADAVIVTEATDRSGTFSTVTHALHQNKEVFAVPGPITSLLSAGPNRLLQEGAHVALNAEDIVSIIAPRLLKKSQQTHLALGDTPVEVTIIELLKGGSMAHDQLLTQLHLPTHEVLQTITLMELKGILHTEGGRLMLAQRLSLY